MPGFCVLEAKQKEEGVCWDLPVLSVGPGKGFSWAPLLTFPFALWGRSWRSSRVTSSKAVGVWFWSGSLNLDTIDILDWIIPCHRAGPAHSRMISSISGFYPLDASSPYPSFDN